MQKQLTWQQLPMNRGRCLSNTGRVIRVVTLLILISTTLASASNYTKETRISLSIDNTIEALFNEIETQTELRFAYSGSTLDANSKVSLDVKNSTVETILDKVLNNKGLTYKIVDDYVIITDIVTDPTSNFAGQIKVISGTVKDHSGSPIAGATVMVKGTTKGVISDMDGNYSLKDVPASSTLIFSFVGMKSQSILVGEKSKIDVVMAIDASELEEVVAIGYGTMKKSDLTGSISQLKAEKLENESTSDVRDLLRSNIAGLTVGYSNEPEGGGSLLVRGNTTITANSSPLIVLDGVIFYGSLEEINPSDIKQVDVLKDASSAAVYGSKAANGVIQITTKSGKNNRGSDKPTVGIEASIGYATPSLTAERVLTPDEFIQWRIDAHEASQRFQTGDDKVSGTEDDQIGYYDNPEDLPSTITLEEWRAYTGSDGSDDISDWLTRINLEAIEQANYKAGTATDWFDAVYQNATRQDYTVSIYGNKPNVNYYWSLGYTDNEGQVYNDRYKTFRSRFNLSAQVNDFIKIGVLAQFQDKDDSAIKSGTGVSNPTPYSSFYTDDTETLINWNPTGNTSTSRHPWNNLTWYDKLAKTQKLNATITSDITFPLDIHLSTQFQNRYEWNKAYTHRYSDYPGANDGGFTNRDDNSSYRWSIDNILKWSKTFNEVHKLSATALQNAEEYQYWSSTIDNSKYEPNDNLGFHAIQSGTDPQVSSNDERDTRSAYMGRLNYNYSDKYMVTGTWRRDGYSAFGQANPTADFWSAALGWVLTEESFLTGPDWLDYLKLRVSYGTNGNDGIGRYDAMANLNTGKYLLAENNNMYYVSQLYVSRMANADLKWEQTGALNAGIDFRLLGGVLGGAVDVYSMETTDLIISRSLPNVTGFSSVLANLGGVKNRGFEISLNSRNYNRKNFKWNTDLQFSLNRNEITSLYGDIDPETGEEFDDYSNEWFIGESIDIIWDYKKEGVWQVDETEEAASYGFSPGDFKNKDVNGDNLYTEIEDKEFLGYTTPRFRWTLRNSMTLYQDFDLSFVIYSQWGHMGTDNGRKNSDDFYDRTSAWKREYWTPENPINDYARIDSNTSYGSVYIDKSFIRLDNIALTYNVPKSVEQLLSMQDFKASVVVRNPYVWCKDWTWGDPEGGSITPTYFTLKLNVKL